MVCLCTITPDACFVQQSVFRVLCAPAPGHIGTIPPSCCLLLFTWHFAAIKRNVQVLMTAARHRLLCVHVEGLPLATTTCILLVVPAQSDAGYCFMLIFSNHCAIITSCCPVSMRCVYRGWWTPNEAVQQPAVALRALYARGCT